jgi:hypothetical protein
VKTKANGARPAAPPSTLEEELAMLDEARAKLAAGDEVAALASLDRYSARRGARLGAEATLLRLQALSAAGRSIEASRLAQKFIEANPDNPLAERARGFIAEPAAPAGEGFESPIPMQPNEPNPTQKRPKETP